MGIIKLINKGITHLYYRVYAKVSKVKFIKRIGVNCKSDNIFIYGDPYSMFGTEPWCISLGDNVHITREVLFITHDGGTLLFRDTIPDLEITAPIVVEDNVYIGARSIILPGVTIGRNSIIAAGSVVSKDVNPNSVYGGVPAKFIKSSEDYLDGIKLRSLKVGHLKGKEKDEALKKILLK